MTFLQKLMGSLSAKPEKHHYKFSVKCMRCGEIIEGRVDLDNDLSIEYEDERDVYYGRKVLMGGGKCFQRLDATFKFTATRTLIEQQVSGGEFVS
jgi:hypothetical protein